MVFECDFGKLDLEKGRALGMLNAKGCTVTCRTGELWITEDRDTKDTILSANRSFEVTQKGLALVFACEDSSFEVRQIPNNARLFVKDEGRRRYLDYRARTDRWCENADKRLRESKLRVRGCVWTFT